MRRSPKKYSKMTEMGMESSDFTYRQYSTMEKAEQLLQLLQSQPSRAAELWDLEARAALLAQFDLTEAELISLRNQINSYNPPDALVFW